MAVLVMVSPLSSKGIIVFVITKACAWRAMFSMALRKIGSRVKKNGAGFSAQINSGGCSAAGGQPGAGSALGLLLALVLAARRRILQRRAV